MRKSDTTWLLILGAIVVFASLFALLTSPYIVKTYDETLLEEVEDCLKNGDFQTYETYYELSDGNFMVDGIGYTFQDKLEVSGKSSSGNKVTYIILSNQNNVTFDEVCEREVLRLSGVPIVNSKDFRVVGIQIENYETYVLPISS